MFSLFHRKKKLLNGWQTVENNRVIRHKAKSGISDKCEIRVKL